MAVGAASGGDAASVAFTSSDLGDFHNFRETNGSVTITIGSGLKSWVSGAVDPAAFGGGSTSTSDCWVARTIALRKKGAGAPAAPVNTELPVVSGANYSGGQLSCSTGKWSGFPLPTFTYQWTLDGADIAGATSNNYTCLAGDVGKTVACKVTATNTEGSATATAAGVTIVDIAMPNILGSPTRSSSTTFSHTVAAGTKCLIVRIAVADEAVLVGPSSCTWNGVAMTRGAYCYGSYNNNGAPAVIFYLMNPTPGTGNVVYSTNDKQYASAENWANVSGVGANKATTAGSSLSSFSFAFTKTNPLNVLIAAASLRSGTGWTPGSNNIEEADVGTTQPTHRLYFGRAETTSTIAASCAGGANTFGSCALELVAG
jgi:hypothetical protein